MNSSALTALKAYHNQMRLMQQAGESAGMAEEAPGQPSFAQMVGNSLKEAAATQYKTDAVKMEAVTGNVDLSDLVTAVANAELTLNTVVAVRDRAIGAYQEILRMAI